MGSQPPKSTSVPVSRASFRRWYANRPDCPPRLATELKTFEDLGGATVRDRIAETTGAAADNIKCGFGRILFQPGRITYSGSWEGSRYRVSTEGLEEQSAVRACRQMFPHIYAALRRFARTSPRSPFFSFSQLEGYIRRQTKRRFADELGYPPESVHDGFVVKARHASALDRIIRQVAMEAFGIPLKTKSSSNIESSVCVSVAPVPLTTLPSSYFYNPPTSIPNTSPIVTGEPASLESLVFVTVSDLPVSRSYLFFYDPTPTLSSSPTHFSNSYRRASDALGPPPSKRSRHRGRRAPRRLGRAESMNLSDRALRPTV